MQLTHVYSGDISKSYNEAGDLIVTGKATGPDLDLDFQRCDPEWLKSAMPAWMEYGNVREMHQPIAAGIGLELEDNGSDWYLKSLVVDESTKKKIETGVLKGYSIGIRNARVQKSSEAPNGLIVGGDIVEISYVDRPANPTARIDIAKSVGGVLQFSEVEDNIVVVDELTKVDESTDTPIVEETPAIEVEVEVVEAEVVEQAEPAIKSLLAALTKAGVGEVHDHDALAAIRDAIVEVIKAELDEMKLGENEVWDIGTLMCSLQDFLCWWQSEADEGETAQPFAEWPETTSADDYDTMALVNLGINPEIVKSANVDNVESIDALRTEVLKALGLQELSAQYEATIASQSEAIEGLRSDLEVVKRTALPGGPALRQTQVQIAKSAEVESRELEAMRYRALASQVENRELQQGYLAKAIQAEADARQLRESANNY